MAGLTRTAQAKTRSARLTMGIAGLNITRSEALTKVLLLQTGGI
ncbi:MAG: hypothetical protein ACRCSP_00360 [Rhodoglobus sp.]